LSYLLTPLLLVLFVVGLVLAPTPIPLGIPIMALSLFALIATNPHAARLVQGLRGRFARLDKAIRFIEDRAGRRIGDTLRRTRPPESS
jgi:hypothetical protein